MLQKTFKYLTIFSALWLIGAGFSYGSWLGALTGFIAAIGIGTGLSIAIAGMGIDDSSSLGENLIHRLGAIVSSVGTAVGIHYGGWRWGWLYGGLGFGVGIIATYLMYFIYLFLTDDGKPTV